MLGTNVGASHPGKFRRFARGQRQVMDKLVSELGNTGPGVIKTVWLHAASLGEYAIARPIINELRRRGNFRIVMTFFSPSGYEVIENKPGEVDYLYYLPLDTRRNVTRFLDLVKPDAAAFMVSEYWYNYLHELKRRGIPTYLISAKITRKSIFNRPYGFLHRRCLSCYRHIFVLDEESRGMLNHLGANNVTVSGNPLFDNAIAKASEQWADAVLNRFTSGHDRIFVAGSVHDDTDIDLIAKLANAHRDTRFIIVPHSISDDFISRIETRLKGGSCRYSCSHDTTTFADTQSIIIDNVGMLAYIYRYGTLAYVGGGFTPLLHSVIEATVYGIPVTFGPCIHRKITPQQLSDLGLGQVIHNYEDLNDWMQRMNGNTRRLCEIRKIALGYISRNAHATEAIVNKMLQQ